MLLGGKRVTAKEEIQSIHWATWTGVLGSEVNGIWPKYTQVNDINATDASFDHKTIVTGDDFGLVKLFRFPCVKKGPSIVLCPLRGVLVQLAYFALGLVCMKCFNLFFAS